MKTYAIANMSQAAATALVTVLMLTGCSREDPKVAPLKSDIETQVKTSLPAFLTVSSLETEIIPVAEERVKINFKAKAAPREDLYIADRRIEGEKPLMLLKKSQSSGTETHIYGSMHARRTMDKWDISKPDIDSGMAQLGSPRGSFDARAFVDGSAEYRKFLADREKEAAEAARLEEEKLRKNEEARLALLEQKRREEEAARKRLQDATAVGKRYRGIVVQSPGQDNEFRQDIELRFTSQAGTFITAEIHNPDQPSHKQTLTGELLPSPQDGQSSREDRHYPIVLSPKNVTKYQKDRLRIYFEQSIVKMDVTEQGLEGIAQAQGSYTQYAFRLQPLD